MANFVFNIAKGRVAELYNRVDTNDPTNSQLIVLAINAGAATDATLMDLATVAAIEADANAAEVTNSGYARKLLVDTDLAAMTVDNTNDRMPLDLPDQTWTSVAAGTAWTDLIIAYDSDSTAGTDSNVIPLTCHDFAVTPNGGNITAQINDFYRAS
jgi:hypothetical protein